MLKRQGLKTLHIFRVLGPVDLKNVRRDSMLLWIPLIPLMVALLFRIATPELETYTRTEFDLDIREYYPLLMSTFLMISPTMVGVIVGFLLLDERDDRMLTAMLVTPIPLSSYLIYRISVPIVLGIGMTLIGFPIAGLVSIPIGSLLLIAILGSLSGPIMALVLATFAENKVAGFAVMKMVNAILMFPTLAFFLKSDWQVLAGIIPAYWSLKVFWLAAEGDSFLIYFVVGIILNVAAIFLLLKRFNTIIHQ
jgi:fluoroquinolone transport system permease protein